MRVHGLAVALAMAVTGPGHADDVRGLSFVCPVRMTISGDPRLLGGEVRRDIRVFVSSSGDVYSMLGGCSQHVGATSGGASSLNGGPRSVTLNCSRRGTPIAITQRASFSNDLLTIERHIMATNGLGREVVDSLAIKLSGGNGMLVRFSRDVQHHGGGRGRGGGGGRGRGGGGAARGTLVGPMACTVGRNAPF